MSHDHIPVSCFPAQEKKKLEEAIAGLIASFESRTGMQLVGPIHFRRESSGEFTVTHVFTDVRVP